MTNNSQVTLVRALQYDRTFPHPCTQPKVIETHISWVILCEDYAYKIKKALNLDFLDFSTLAKRKYYCEEEVRLNRRLARDIYLGVVHFTGSPSQPILGGEGKPIEYAVKMRRFAHDGLLSDLADSGHLNEKQVMRMAEQISEFHTRIPAAPAHSEWGGPTQVHAPVAENFAQIDSYLKTAADRTMLEDLRTWSEQEFLRIEAALAQRKQDGFVRECHGDMHLGNMTWHHDDLLIFDGIEFAPALYWIDVMSEVAFVCMDLEDHGARPMAYRFLNDYLDRNGDYDGVALLRYYLVYRAMVRAKVAAIRLEQSDQHDQLQTLRNYMQLASRYIQPPTPVLMLTHGLSGSGKSTFSAQLAHQWPAIRVRSDRERQRLYPDSAPLAGASGRYSVQATRATYARLLRLADILLRAGYSTIVDATFLHAEQRLPFRQLAEDLGVPIRILHFVADPDRLRERVRQRQQRSDDISEAGINILERQIIDYRPLDADETGEAIIVDTERLDGDDSIQPLVRNSLHH